MFNRVLDTPLIFHGLKKCYEGLKPIHATGLFLYPLTTSKNQSFYVLMFLVGIDKWFNLYFSGISISQPAFTCLKFTIETLEQGVKYVQSSQ